MNHGGNIYQFARKIGCLPEQVLDFSANINPVQAVDLSCLQKVQLGPYADPDYNGLKQAIKQRYPYPSGVDIELFNGASAAIFALLRNLQPQDLVLYAPLYGEYAHIAEELDCKVHYIDRFSRLMADIPAHSTVIFVNPSTPDGQLYDLQALLATWQAAACTIIIDESFLDFSTARDGGSVAIGREPMRPTARDGGRDCSRQSSAFPPSMEVRSVAIGREPMQPEADSVAQHIRHYDKLYLIKSLSKFYGCAGIRIGFILAATAAIKALQRFEPAWKLSSLDMAYMQQALANTGFIEQTRQQTAHLRGLLHQALQDSGLFDKIYPGQANFLLARLANDGDGYQLQTQLESSLILIRVCDNFAGLDKSHVRFAVKDEQAIARLAYSFENIKK
ncbi:aminotransferase class I/II-fold pyridoxal phosphate-dependent enzyme [Methylobacter sp. G7]|uniref:aminotransferase class I/II-fold pyridoxal phosphate-dependent enzyme n=1 Tax=Methylobacter sp. G7 TaxID=3230117 RepID=UPI003D805C1A